MELEADFGKLLRVWWAHFWRAFLAWIASMIVGFLVGAVVGFILGMMGVPVKVIQIVCFPLGLVIGIAFSFFPIWGIVNKDFGEFRLILVSNQPQDPAPMPGGPEGLQS